MKHHAPFSKNYRFRFGYSAVAPAFTLIELLVVITLITVLLTVGAMGLKNMAKSSGVSAGVPIAEALFAEARTMAISKGTKVRVLVHAKNEPGDEYHRDRYLRYMAIAYEDVDDDGNPSGGWVVASKGSLLPKGVYYSEKLSKRAGVPLPPKMTITLPGNSSSTCYFYEFNSEGLINNPKPDPSGSRVPAFVIVSGSLPPGKKEPIIKGKNVGGFVIWRTGRTSVFRHPDQIRYNGPSGIKESDKNSDQSDLEL